MTTTDLNSIILRGTINGCVFAALWGTWAYYINFSGDYSIALTAAITQSCFTLVNAFVYSVFMEHMFSLSDRPGWRVFNAWVVPNSLVTLLLATVHYLRGTPAIFPTIAPPLAIVFILSAVYVLRIGPKQYQQQLALSH